MFKHVEGGDNVERAGEGADLFRGRYPQNRPGSVSPRLLDSVFGDIDAVRLEPVFQPHQDIAQPAADFKNLA